MTYADYIDPQGYACSKIDVGGSGPGFVDLNWSTADD